jgi:hypothetical protein
MLPAVAMNPQAKQPCITLESFIFSCRVSLAEYNWVLRVLFSLLQVIGVFWADTCVWKPLVGLAKISFTCGHRVYLKLPPKTFYEGKTYNMLSFMHINFHHINVNFSINYFYFAETLITFYIPLSNDELLWCCTKSDVRTGKDVISFILSFMILM